MLACSALFTTVASASVSDGTLGNVMYVGDSITHGINSGSWRWTTPFPSPPPPETLCLVNGGKPSLLKLGMMEWTAAAATALVPAGAKAIYNVRNGTSANIAGITATGSTKHMFAYGSADSPQGCG